MPGACQGAVVHVERRGVVALSQSIGLRDPAASAPMRADSIFRIYSMTKPIVSVAAMRLFEQGRLRLDDPVSRFIPEFAATQVLVEAGAAHTLIAARQPITVQDLLRHTAGLTYEFLPPSAVRRLYIERNFYSRERSNAELAAALAALPLQHQPGSVWEYSRATDVLGRVVEVVAGRALGAHLREALFEPLGMVDTGFHVPPAQQGRIAEGFAVDPDSGEASALVDVRAPAAFESGGGGLVSTAADYARFTRMLLRGGELEGHACPRAQDGRIHDQRSPGHDPGGRRRAAGRPTVSASASRCGLRTASPPCRARPAPTAGAARSARSSLSTRTSSCSRS